MADHRHDLGPKIPAEPFAAWCRAQLVALERGGADDPNSQLAERLGVTSRTVYRYARQLDGEGKPTECLRLYPIEDALWRAGLHVWDVYPDDPAAQLDGDQVGDVDPLAEALAEEMPATARRGKPAGKWGKLTDSEVAAAHLIYQRTGWSLRRLGASIAERYGFSSAGSAAESLRGSFARLGLPTRNQGKATAAANVERGTGLTRGELRRRSGEIRGVRCAGVRTQYPRKGQPCGRPAAKGSRYCPHHDPDTAGERAERMAAMRARRAA